MFTILYILLLLFSISESQLEFYAWQLPQDNCQPGFQTNPNSPNVGCFRLITREMSFENAEANCLLMGASLASVSNIEEQAFIASMTGSVPAWIGEILNFDGSGFRWGDGKPVGFTNFSPGEPIRNHGSCIITSNTGWKTAPCLSWAPAICRNDNIIFERKN